MTKPLYENDFLRIDMLNPNYPYLTMKKGGVVIVPYDSEGNIYLIEKDRPGIGTYLELPRGFVELGETSKVGAFRELLEETGMESTNIEYIGTVQPDTGVVNNSVPVCQVLVKSSKLKKYEHVDTEDKETCAVHKCSLTRIEKHMFEGKIVCGYTQSALFQKILKDKLHIQGR